MALKKNKKILLYNIQTTNQILYKTKHLCPST